MYFIILAFIALGSLLIWYFLRHDHGRQLPVGSLWAACGFGAISIALAFIVELFFPNSLWAAPAHNALSERLLLFLGVGAVEEAAKFIPLTLFIYRKAYFRDRTDGVIYFAIAGLTFGL